MPLSEGLKGKVIPLRGIIGAAPLGGFSGQRPERRVQGEGHSLPRFPKGWNPLA